MQIIGDSPLEFDKFDLPNVKWEPSRDDRRCWSPCICVVYCNWLKIFIPCVKFDSDLNFFEVSSKPKISDIKKKGV